MAIKVRNQILVSLSCFILLMQHSYSQTPRDSIMPGKPLTDGETLVSAYGKFRLGFRGFSRHRYLGIWYHRTDSTDYYKEIIWVANRNNPILGTGSNLTIDSTDGNLKILPNGTDPIVISSIQAAGNTSATLLETGNFVLYEMNSDGSNRRVLWQSFDHPTDTLLPGMKIGVNLQTGHKWFLQSWISYYSAAQGSFTLSMDPNVSNQLIMSWRGDVYRTSGYWLNGHFNSSRPWATGTYKFNYTSNEVEKFFTYSLIQESDVSFPMIKMNFDGSLTDHGEYPLSQCDYRTLIRTSRSGNYAACWNGKIPSCRSSVNSFNGNYGFMSGDGFKFKESDNMTFADCFAKCFSNCSCVAFATTLSGGCEIWGTETNFTETETNFTDFLIFGNRVRPIFTEAKPEIHEVPKEKNGSLSIIAIAGALLAIVYCPMSYLGRRLKYNRERYEQKWWKFLIIVIAIALVLPVLCYLCYLIWRNSKAKVERIRNRRKLLGELGGDVSLPLTSGDGRTEEKDQNVTHKLKLFDFQTIAAATNNFSTSQLHNNLVRLLGCSLHGEERILVYEYMPNKSLDFFIFHSDRKNLLNWKKRFNIIEGIAQGLLYLHKYSRLRVIHRDLKTSNILLDNQMNPKISDFGMAKIFRFDEHEANTKRVVGTYGYMSPEYAMNGVVSIKTDVFSFGVLVLEIVSGKKNNSCYHTERLLNLVGYAWLLWNERKGLELIDPGLEDGSSSPNEVLRCIHVGLLCVQDQAIDRPTMSDVVSMLTNESLLLPAPKQPAFYVSDTNEVPEIAEINSENCSTNNVTISEIEAR
ncbi:G-type lectin S-receptor-like serine/threonine-protein kinase CES101 [Pistacia vera]|uniref:G-type lectin S-receptor-like serine/threonine-protein kinase CES101 n=1 Tax=Pistacia vera TaxID=55513 RepID=UPI001263E645|nr:G-type lectin S-receptor-like serine/threonine-protein kinase CES101 [Pistacia vera]